jgi:serpin B
VVNFSGVSDAARLWISTVVQKAFIEVNEEGSEAAAATAAIMMMRAALMTPQFIFDRPFVYFIKDNLTQLVLFGGRVANPTKN